MGSAIGSTSPESSTSSTSSSTLPPKMASALSRTTLECEARRQRTTSGGRGKGRTSSGLLPITLSIVLLLFTSLPTLASSLPPMMEPNPLLAIRQGGPSSTFQPLHHTKEVIIPSNPGSPFDPEFEFPSRKLQFEPRAPGIPTSNLPFPPKQWLNINNATSVAELSYVAINRMQTWFGDNAQYQWTPWWQYPVVGIVYADIDNVLGNQGNRDLITQMLDKNDFGVNYMIDAYIDDQLWWGIFAVKSYLLYGNDNWLASAQAIHSNSSKYWDDQCGGGVIWLTSKPKYKNTVTNMLYFSLSALLYRVSGDMYYFQESQRTLDWWLGWAFDPTTGKVYDGLTDAPDCKPSGSQIYTYNSGIVLFGLVDLYYATNEQKLLDLARTIAYAGIRDYSTKDTGILQESCERDPQPAYNLPPGCQQDQVVFKGIFTMGLGYLFGATTDGTILNFLNTQMLSNAFNNLDDTWLFGEWWMGPWNITTAGPKTQINALALLSAALVSDINYLTRAQAAASAPSNSSSNSTAGNAAQAPVVVITFTESAIAAPTGNGNMGTKSGGGAAGLRASVFGLGSGLVVGTVLLGLVVGLGVVVA